jgi:hypothetical protein
MPGLKSRPISKAEFFPHPVKPFCLDKALPRTKEGDEEVDADRGTVTSAAKAGLLLASYGTDKSVPLTKRFFQHLLKSAATLKGGS